MIHPDVLVTDAINVLRQRGWTQDRLIDPDDGSVCIMGALQIAAGGVPEDDYIALRTPEMDLTAYEVTRKALDKLTHHGLSNFNDCTARNADDAVRFLRRAAFSFRLRRWLGLM